MRYVLIDYMHLAHRCIHAEPLSVMVNMGGELQLIDTTIPNYTIKNIFNYSGKGSFLTGVFYEGGNSFRKKYFQEHSDQDYKGSRGKKNNTFYDGINLTINLLQQGQVSQYRVQGYEADDLIWSMVQKIKSFDQVTPIDIITNDSDLLPLVDDQVSVYIRGTRQYADVGCPERRLYYQVTPKTWLDYLSYTSAYKQFYIPYNSMLLFKLIRGDKADEIEGAVKGFGGKKYSDLMYKMESDGVDFLKTFRYGVDFNEVMRPVLENYFSKDIVDKMEYIYNGINLRYVDLQLPKVIEFGYLQSALSPLKIRLSI